MTWKIAQKILQLNQKNEDNIGVTILKSEEVKVIKRHAKKNGNQR